MLNQTARVHQIFCISKNVLCALVLSIGFPASAVSNDAENSSNPDLEVNGLRPAKDPGSGLIFMMPAGYFRRERPSGSTSIADANGSTFRVDVVKADDLYKTEADMNRVMSESASQNHDRKVEKSIKVHGFPAREWSFKNDLGWTKVVVICTPKNYFTCVWHADKDLSQARKARDTFFSGLDPNCPPLENSSTK